MMKREEKLSIVNINFIVIIKYWWNCEKWVCIIKINWSNYIEIYEESKWVIRGHFYKFITVIYQKNLIVDKIVNIINGILFMW